MAHLEHIFPESELPKLEEPSWSDSHPRGIFFDPESPAASIEGWFESYGADSIERVHHFQPERTGSDVEPGIVNHSHYLELVRQETRDGDHYLFCLYQSIGPHIDNKLVEFSIVEGEITDAVVNAGPVSAEQVVALLKKQFPRRPGNS